LASTNLRTEALKPLSEFMAIGGPSVNYRREMLHKQWSVLMKYYWLSLKVGAYKKERDVHTTVQWHALSPCLKKVAHHTFQNIFLQGWPIAKI